MTLIPKIQNLVGNFSCILCSMTLCKRQFVKLLFFKMVSPFPQVLVKPFLVFLVNFDCQTSLSMAHEQTTVEIIIIIICN